MKSEYFHISFSTAGLRYFDVIASLLQEKEELLNYAGECGLEILHQSQQHMEEQRVLHEREMEEKNQELNKLKVGEQVSLKFSFLFLYQSKDIN